MSPSKNHLSPRNLGTDFINNDNGLGVVFAFVPNVPKIFERYPEESARHAVDDLFIK